MADYSTLPDDEILRMIQQSQSADYSKLSDADLMARIQQAQPSGKPGYAEDIAKSGGVGLAEGAIGIAGMPGDIAEIGARGIDYATRGVGGGINWASRQLGGGDVVNVQPRAAREPTYGSADIKKGIEGYTGEFYKPQTIPGEYARTMGQMAPAALVPGGAAQRVLNVAVPAVTSETAGQLTKGKAIEPWARAGGALAGGIAANRLVTPFPARPERTALAATLDREGVPMTAGQRTGSMPLRWMEEAAADNIMSGGKAAKMNEATGRAFTGAALERMGMPRGEIATADALDRGVKAISNKFETVGARNTIAVDRTFGQDLVKTAQDYVDLVGQQGAKPIVNKMMQNIVEVAQKNGGAIPGPTYQVLRSTADRTARGIAQADPQTSQALRGIRDALDDAMGRSVSPADQALWSEARREWKNWKAIEKATTGAGSQAAEGFISPSALRTAVKGQGAGQYARGKGDLAELARAGEAILKPLPQSGTTPRAQASNFFTSIGGGLAGGVASGGNPIGFAAGAVTPGMLGRALLSKPMQAYLGNQAAPVTRSQMIGATLMQQLQARPQTLLGM